jgi:predicted choloylglycine hydrolase
MIQIKARCLELKGTNYEIGRKMGSLAAGIPQLKEVQTSGRIKLDEQDALASKELFGRWCPGINEEIHGFADALNVPPDRIIYYAMTCLVPRCSHMAFLPGMTENGHVLVARNYEFCHRLEDFVLARTSVAGKLAHLGTTILQFGRDEGMNECGLSVSMSSCGFPVGAEKQMRAPALRGLQFWAVVRTLLENCKDVDEALLFLDGMPIAYNINLLLADKSGHAALVETMDGVRAIRKIDGNTPQKFLYAANHIMIPELLKYEPKAMAHSLKRSETIRKFSDGAHAVSKEDLKSLLLTKYPEGLCCHYYDEFFGTTKSIVMDLNDGLLDLCWGGLAGNGWQVYTVGEPVEEREQPVGIRIEPSAPGIYDYVSL